MAQATLFAISGVVGLVVAVGERGRIQHFEGDVYHARDMPSPTRATLRAVHVESLDSAWAVGDGVVLRWDGASWRSLPVAPYESLRAVWGHRDTGVWVSGKGVLYHYGSDGSGPTMFTSDVGAVSVWGSGADDMFFVVDGCALMHWTAGRCDAEPLPGDGAEQWVALAGSGADEPVYVVGPADYCVEWTRAGWFELASYSDHRANAACSRWANDLWVATDGGQVRHWNGFDWRVVAFSAFGPLYGLCHVDNVIWACGARGVVIQHQPDDGGRKE